MKKFILSILINFFIVLSVFSETSSDSVIVYGFIIDQNQNKIDNVKVYVINELTLDTATVVTDSTGFYRITLKKMNTAIKKEQTPKDFILNQNYPNPFISSTIISFYLNQMSDVTLEIYNTLGQRIRTLANQYFSAGMSKIQWDGTDDFGSAVSNGVYFYKFQTRDYSKIQKMVFLDGSVINSFGISGLQKHISIYEKDQQIQRYKIIAQKLGFHHIHDELLELDAKETIVEKNFFIRRINYFPLAVGNSWTFRRHGASEADTVTYYIERKIIIDDKQYYEFHNQRIIFVSSIFMLIRSNEKFDLIGRIDNQEQIVIEFSNFTFGQRIIHYDSTKRYEMDIDIYSSLNLYNENIETYCGIFEKCINYSFYVSPFTDSNSETFFAPETGPVKFYINGEGPYLLIRTVIKKE